MGYTLQAKIPILIHLLILVFDLFIFIYFFLLLIAYFIHMQMGNKKGLKLLPVKPFLFPNVSLIGLFSNKFIEDLKKLVDVFQLLSVS